jgi:hypothetical protein
MSASVPVVIHDELIPFDSTPNYVAEVNGQDDLSALGRDDFKTPRIVLLQGLSPQLTLFPDTARAGQYWHTGLNVPLGEEFHFVIATVHKRVILWRPRNDSGGGILAYSKDGKRWDVGGNTEFTVKLKNRKQPVVWNTRNDVTGSGLTQFGSADPDNDSSGPAATIVYEYLVFIVHHPELSPAVFSASMTSLNNAKALNTSLLTLTKAGRPMQQVAVKAFVQSKTNDDGTWTVPNFKPAGLVPQSVYEDVMAIKEKFNDYQVDYKDEQGAAVDAKVPDYQTAY